MQKSMSPGDIVHHVAPARVMPMDDASWAQAYYTLGIVLLIHPFRHPHPRLHLHTWGVAEPNHMIRDWQGAGEQIARAKIYFAHSRP